MKKRNYFASMQNAAVGMVGLGITTAVVSGIDSKLPAGAKMGPAMNTLVGFTPIIMTGIGAKTVLDAMPRVKRKYRY